MKKTKQSLRDKSLNQKIYYDKKTDVLWFNIKKGLEEEHREVAPGVSVELGKNEELLGIEILDASKVLGATMDLKKATSKAVSNYSTTIPHKIR